MATTGLAAVASYFYASRVETENLRLEKVRIPVQGLGPGLDGLRVVLMADFHLYPHTTIDLIGRAVQMANRLKPDLIVLGGDYVLREVDSIFDLAPVLAGLNAKHGVFSILGNHDHWSGAEVVSRGLQKSRLPLLRNQGVTLAVGRDRLYLAGLDDGWVRRHDLGLALDNRPSGVPTVALMHEPDFADEFSQDHRVSVQLSGHSHGGQVRFPFIGSPFLPPYGRKYDQGLYRVGRMWLYTNVGIGVTAPVRLNCPPEVTEITLLAT